MKWPNGGTNQTKKWETKDEGMNGLTTNQWVNEVARNYFSTSELLSKWQAQ